MFMVSFRLRGKRLLGVCAVVLVLALGFLGVRALVGENTVAAGATQKPASVKAKTNDQRLEFIRSFGWEVVEEAEEVMEVVIPKEFDAVYEQYNSMQKVLGFDLAKHAGKRVKRYTYIVTNYPGQAEDVRINLLVRSGKVVGGDVCSLLQDGFLHGFTMPEQSFAQTGEA